MNENQSNHGHDKEDKKTFSMYRTITNGELAVVVMSEGACMLEKHDSLTNSARCTIGHHAGANVLKSIKEGKSLHFHMKKDGPIVFMKSQKK